MKKTPALFVQVHVALIKNLQILLLIIGYHNELGLKIKLLYPMRPMRGGQHFIIKHNASLCDVFLLLS